jgi:hypothetical protein
MAEERAMPQMTAVDHQILAASPPESQINSALPDPLDLDVTVLAFAQWVSEMKTRQHNSQHQMQAEMSIIRNAINTNNTDLTDFKRHSAAIQQQMQAEISEIRESLSNVFMEITAAVRNNAAADQDIKLNIQSLNEQAVRNETAFAQLADAADQSQSKLRNAVQEMQLQSERMRDELVTLNRYTENLEQTVTERTDRISLNIDSLTQDQNSQLEQRKEHVKKMANDVGLIGESLQNLVADFGEQKKQTSQVQSRLQSSLFVLDQSQKKEATNEDAKLRSQLRGISEGLTATSESLQQASRYMTPVQQRAPNGVQQPPQTQAAYSAALPAGVRPMMQQPVMGGGSVVYR